MNIVISKRQPELRFPKFEGSPDRLTELSRIAIANGLQTGPFGSQLKAEEYTSSANDTPVVMPRDISEGRIRTVRIARVSQTKSIEMKRHRLQVGDVVFPRRGELGRIAIVKDAQVGWLCGTGCLRLRPDSKQADADYLGFSFQRCRILHWLESNAVGQTMLNLNTEILGHMPIRIPSLPEQKKIADFLGAVDGKLAALREKEAALTRFKRGLMQALFSQTLRFTRDDGSNYPDWEDKRLDQVGIFKSGVGFSEVEQGGKIGTPFFKVSDMNLAGNETEMLQANHYVTDQQIERLKYKPILESSVIFAKVGAAVFLERKRRAERFLLDNNMMAFIPNEALLFDYSLVLFHNLRLSKYAQVGALPSYNASDLASIRVSIPSLHEQHKIATAQSAMDTKISAVANQITHLTAFKKGLLQQMFV